MKKGIMSPVSYSFFDFILVDDSILLGLSTSSQTEYVDLCEP